MLAINDRGGSAHDQEGRSKQKRAAPGAASPPSHARPMVFELSSGSTARHPVTRPLSWIGSTPLSGSAPTLYAQQLIRKRS